MAILYMSADWRTYTKTKEGKRLKTTVYKEELLGVAHLILN